MRRDLDLFTDSTTERWIDGSFGNDLPMMRIGRLHNVNHFIVSQVNPHVLPFQERNRWTLQGLALRAATKPVRSRYQVCLLKSPQVNPKSL